MEKNDLFVTLGRLARFKEHLAPVAVTGSYDDLADKPDRFFTEADLATDEDIDAMFEEISP